MSTPPIRVTTLLLVRHGEGWCNVERTIEGRATCRGLTPRGRAQVGALAARLLDEASPTPVRPAPGPNGPGPTGVDHTTQAEVAAYASPIRRARETADIVAAGLDVTVVSDDDLEEVRPGEAEGMTWDQWEAFFGADAWSPTRPFAPGAEAWMDFALRVGRCLDRVVAKHLDGKIYVFAHGGVVDAAFFHFLGLDPAVVSPIDFHTSNASITEWQLRHSPGGPGRDDIDRWRLVRYNDHAHLHNVGAGRW